MIGLKIKRWWNGTAARERLIAEAAAVNRMAAEFMAERARVYCPVDTGELRASIQAIHEADGMRSHVVATARHAEPVEFGHVMRNGAFYPPNPFLRRALRETVAAYPRFARDAKVRQGHHHGRLMGATFE